MLSFDPSYFLAVFPQIAAALPFTFYVVAAAAAMSLLAGAAVAAVRIARVPVLYALCEVWLSFVRSMPFVLLLFLMYFTVPAFLRAAGLDTSRLPKEVYVFAAVVFGFAPVIGEVIRPAYLSVDRGQHDAARAFGFSDFDRIFRIIVPQMIPIAAPPLMNQVIEIVKDTSLMYLIGLMDLMGRANLLIHVNMGRGKLENYAAVALLYWVLVAVLEAAAQYLSRRSSGGFPGGAS